MTNPIGPRSQQVQENTPADSRTLGSAQASESGREASPTTPRAAWPWLVLVVALAASLWLWRWLQTEDRAESARGAQAQAQRVIDTFEADLATLEVTMRGITATIAAGIAFDQVTWAHYVDSLGLGSAYGDAIGSVGFAERVAREDLPRHLARWRRALPAYTVHPDAGYPVLYPIVLLRRTTEADLPAPLGYDPFTSLERRTAMEESLARRGIAYSGGLVQVMPAPGAGSARPDASPGMLVLAPVLPRDPATAHAGFVGVFLRPERLLARNLENAPEVGATLKVSHGESGPISLAAGLRPAAGNVLARQTAVISRGGARWALEVVVADTAPFTPLLLPALIAISLALFGISLAIDGARRRVEAALADARAEGDAKFREFAQDAPFLVWLCDTHLRPTFVNAAWTEATGQAGADARGKGWQAFVHPDDLPPLRSTFRRIVQAPEPCTVRARTLMRDGSYRWFVASLRPRRDRDGKHVGFIGISLDIHEMKSAEMALERERALLRGVLDGSPGAVFAKDSAHRYILMNPRIQGFFGVAPERFLGGTDADFFPPERAARVIAQDDAVLKDGKSVQVQETFVDQEGRTRWALKSSNPVTLPSGERLLVGWALDISDLKRLELEAATARRRLEVLNQLATRTLAGASPAELQCFAVEALETLVRDARIQLLPLTSALPLGTDPATAGPEDPLHGQGRAPTALDALRSGLTIVLPATGESCLAPAEIAALLPSGMGARILAPMARRDHLRAIMSVECDAERAWTPDEVQATTELVAALMAAVEFCEARSERERAEAALRESQVLLQGIIDALPVGLAVKDEDGGWVVVNEALSRMTSRPISQLLMHTNRDLYAPAIAERFDAEDAEALASLTPIAVEWELVNPSDNVRWVVKVKSPLTLPDGRRFLISALVDITPQKLAALEVERSRRFLDALLNALPQAVYVRDEGGRTILANDEYYRLTQRTPNEVIGRTSSETFGKTVGAMLEQQDREAWNAGHVVEFEQRTMDPRMLARWQMKSKAAITMPDGSRYLVCLSRDISPLKQAVTELEASKKFVESLIDAVPQGIFVKDETGRWIMANEPFLRMAALGREAILGRTNIDIYGPVDGARFDAQDEQAWRGSGTLLFEEESPMTESGPRWQAKSKTAVRMADGSRYLVCTVTDASHRRTADLALQRNRAFLTAIIDAAPVLIFVKDEAHRFVMVNAAAERAIGRPRSEIIGTSDFDVVTHEFAVQAWAEDDALLAGAAPITTEQIMQFREKPPRWVLRTKLVTTLDDGARCVIAVSLDITERRRAEQDALDARSRLEVLNGIAADMTAELALPELLRNALSRMSDALGGLSAGLWSRTGSEVHVLAAHAGILPEGVLPGHDWRPAMRPMELEVLERGDPLIVDGTDGSDAPEGAPTYPGRAFIAIPIRGTHGTRPRAVVSLSSPVPRVWRDHERQTATEVGEALTLAHLKADADADNARIEAELRASEATLRATVWASDLGMWSLDLVGDVVRFSDRWKSQLGFAPDEIQDSFETWVDHLHPDDRDAAQSTVQDALASRGGLYQSEFRLRHRDGSWRNILSRAQIQRNADGRPLRMVGGHIDVTDYRRAQEDLRRHRDDLEQRVAERTADAVRAKELAEAANRAKSEFLANMSHELRTPMHAILSFSRLGQDRLDGGAAQIPKIATYLGRIEQSGHRLLGLLNDLLDLSKLESGKMRYDFGVHDLREVAGIVIGELSAYARERNVHVALSAAPAPVEAFCDPVRIGQVIRNLVSNAIRFTGEGTRVTIEVTAGATLPTPDGGALDAAALRVTDEGIGVPAEELERVFDKFVQSSTTASGAGGTGLGLAICREIANHHGGRIWADNNPVRGACFTMLVPIGGPIDRPQQSGAPIVANG